MRMKHVYHKKINSLIKNSKCNPISIKYKRDIYKEFQKYNFKKISTKWHQFYSYYFGKQEVEFISELLFYSRIEPALNNSIMYPALEDKNLLGHFFEDSSLPNSIVKNIHGFYYINNQQVNLEKAIEACNHFDAIVIKPSMGTAGGKGVKKIVLEKDCSTQLKKLFKEYKTNFIVQEILEQHPKLAELNKSSLNTIRVISYMRCQEVIPLSALIRIGRSGSFTDNTTGGGLVCGIDPKGKLFDIGLDGHGKKYLKTDNGTLLKDFQLPCFELIFDKVKELHQNMPHFRLISWDVVIKNDSEIGIIEYNASGQDINLHQMINGPLFGGYYNEIIEIAHKFNPLDNLLKYGG